METEVEVVEMEAGLDDQISPEELMGFAAEYAAHVEHQETERAKRGVKLLPSAEWTRIYELGRQAGLNEAQLAHHKEGAG